MNTSDAPAASIRLGEILAAANPLSRNRDPGKRKMPRRHVLMLVLAAEVLLLGFRYADRYQPPGIAVEQTFTEGHVIT